MTRSGLMMNKKLTKKKRRLSFTGAVITGG
jgi:hypothetical protein